MADGDRRLAGHEPHPHQSQADPRQPILTRLTVGVEKGSNALENRREFSSSEISQPIIFDYLIYIFYIMTNGSQFIFIKTKILYK